MKKTITVFLCILIALTISGCKSKDNQDPSPGTTNSSNSSEGTGESTPATIVSSDIILDIDKVLESSDKTGVSGKLQMNVAVGASVQIVGVGRKPVSATISAIEVDGVAQDKGQAGGTVNLFLDIKKSDLENMERIVIAKLKKESELKPVGTIDDLFGKLNGNVYSNESFGMTIDLGKSGFKAAINTQEGFKVSFSSPQSFYDNDILQITSADYTGYVYLYVSNKQSLNSKTAAEQLALEYGKYNVVPDKMLLSDKEVEHVQIKDGNKVTDCYAMIVNGYYIKWKVADENNTYKNQLAEIMGSVKFDWVKE